MLDALLDLVLPRCCAGCSATGVGLCQACRGLLAGHAMGLVRPDPCPPGLPPLTAFVAYEGAAQRLLLSHKEKGRLQLAKPLGTALASAVLLHGHESVLLCPVPSSPKAVRQRGQDHAMRLATAAASSLRLRGLDARAARLLVSTRAVADQSGLSTAARAANLRGALRAVGPPRTGVVVVDDVVTTGATLVEAARALAAAGHDVRGAAVVAATTRRRTRRPPVDEHHPEGGQALLPGQEGG